MDRSLTWHLEPHYLAHPSLIARRVRAGTLRRRGLPRISEARHITGRAIQVFSGDAIGWALLRFGFYDLAVTEAVHRLAIPGDAVIDVGANVGHIALTAARRVGPSGHVETIEPEPEVLSLLRANIEAWAGDKDLAPVSLHEVAAGDCDGEVALTVPVPSNMGTARVTADINAQHVAVPMRRLDDLVASADLIKLDVEGAESQVLAGAARLLGGVRDIVFEDHVTTIGVPSALVCSLESNGFTVLRIGKALHAPILVDLGTAEHIKSFEPPSYLATRDAARALDIFASRGWKSLGT